MPRFDLNSYVTVNERVAAVQSVLLRITTETPVMLTEVMGYTRSVVVLTDGRSATGHASFRLDLQDRSAQSTSPIEDCETSSVGRALAFLGFETTRGIASREEVQEARRREDTPMRTANPPTHRVLTQDAAAYRLRLWHGLETLVGEARVLGIATSEIEQAQMDGKATNEEIIAHGQQLRAAINKYKTDAVVDDAELNPAGMAR